MKKVGVFIVGNYVGGGEIFSITTLLAPSWSEFSESGTRRCTK